MPVLSRRAALKGLGAFGVAAALPTAARAAAPEAHPAGAPGADHHTVSAHTFNVGDAMVTAIRDTGFMLPLSAIGTNVTQDAVEALLADYGLPTSGVPTDVSMLLIQTGDETVLIDTGTGGGDLMGTMRALGIAPGDVTRVVISHHHGDHIGGLAPGGTPAFPGASVHVSQTEMTFLQSADSDGARGALAALEASGAVTFAAGDELVPGLTAIEAYGHTPGHTAFLLASGEARLMIVSDAVAHPVAFFAHPEWLFGFDMDPAPTVATRRRLLGRAADERIPLFASHMPFPGIGRVSRDGGGFRFTPAPYAA